MNSTLRALGWIVVGLMGAGALSGIAFSRGEPITGTWFVVAAVCSYMLAYRFYSSFIAAKVMALDDTRATPAEVKEDGRDYVPTNKWVLAGHHFAAIAGPGPLVGPTLAAQFGYLPGTLWIIIGGCLAGCVQDFVILFCSMRRGGKTLGQMAKEEVGARGGFIALIAVLIIMAILLSVVALVVVNALKESAWGTYTLAMTVPVALLMGVYLRFVRPGKVMEATAIGLALTAFAVVSGQWVSNSATWAPVFTLTGTTLAAAIIIYGFAASALPVWLLLAPRDYLSAFVKVGAILAMALGILVVRPEIHMPALTGFVDGTGPVFAGKVFPFCFITIACGAISGFHALVSSGTTPRMIQRESHARMIGYGSMLMESFVGIMAMVAACALQPGVYFAINSPAGVIGSNSVAAAAKITSWGYPVEGATMDALARSVGETSLLNRTGGAPSLAVGMARIFATTLGGEELLAIWYHFAIMFEALFILTVLDAGTRVGRFMVQELLGHVYPPLGATGSYGSILFASFLTCGCWGYFLWQGVIDPLGGINSLWPLFGIANQLLASCALVVATTILLKMGKKRHAWVTVLPMLWLIAVTMTASYQKIFSDSPKLGFLANAHALQAQIASGAIPGDALARTQTLIFNNYLNVAVTSVLVTLILVLVFEAVSVWIRLRAGSTEGTLNETPYVATRWPAEGRA
jgi:carbon starvation protein